MSFQTTKPFPLPFHPAPKPLLQESQSFSCQDLLPELDDGKSFRAPRAVSSDITKTIRNPVLISVIEEYNLGDDWHVVTMVKGSPAESNAGDSTSTSSSADTKSNTNNDGAGFGEGKLNAPTMQLLNIVHDDVPVHELMLRRNAAARLHCASLKTLGCASLSDSIDNMDKLINNEPWNPCNPCPPNSELIGIGGWAN